MLEPRRAMVPAGASAARSTPAIATTSESMRPSIGPSLSPWPRWSKVSTASPAAIAARAKSKWLSWRESAPCSTSTPAVGGSGPRR